MISFIEPPYYWMKHNVTCRDWKMNYCCENLWGMPGLYKLVAQAAEGKVPKPKSETDVLVDPPLKRHLFEDCDWQPFVGYLKKIPGFIFWIRYLIWPSFQLASNS